VLRVADLHAAYRGVPALWGVTLTVEQGEIVALVGSNGAGKSTLLKTIVGLLAPTRGSITFDGRPIGGRPPDVVTAAGVGYVPEGRQLFAGLTVRENLQMGAYLRRDRADIHRSLTQVCDLFPVLRDRQAQLAGTLSGGEQQMVAIGRALMSEGRLLLIDELSLGLAPIVVDGLLKTLQHINRSGITILLVEQDVRTALEVASRGYVIEAGRVTMSGAAATLLADGRVKEAYLGL
jgi:branched-chain amino acid transport system ATP-binding protein